MAELNPYVAINVSTDSLHGDLTFLKDFQVDGLGAMLTFACLSVYVVYSHTHTYILSLSILPFSPLSFSLSPSLQP